MAFCASCGSQMDGRFCAKCGAMAAAEVPPVPGGAPPPTYAAQAVPAGMSDNVASALCYLFGFITGIIFLVLAPYNQNRTVRFHAFQSIFLNVGALICSIGISILFGMLHFIGLFFGLFLGPLIWLLFFCLWLYMMWSAYQGKKVMLPIIGDLAQKQA